MAHNSTPRKVDLFIELFKKGEKRTKIAEVINRDKRTVYAWIKQYKKTGTITFNSSSHGYKVSDEELKVIEEELLKGPHYHGYDNEVWTMKRINEVLYKCTGKTLSDKTLTKLMRRLGWSRQRPTKQSHKYNKENELTWIKNIFEENIKKK